MSHPLRGFDTRRPCRGAELEMGIRQLALPASDRLLAAVS